MKRTFFAAVLLALANTAFASWWWPFGSDDSNEPPRISELVRPASELIDEAADLADQGKVSEAVEKYHHALMELERIEVENPERAQKVEFQTVYNKRAYVNAAIDSLLFKQAKENAKKVSVTDTTELQKKFDREKANAKLSGAEKMKIAQKEAAAHEDQATAASAAAKPAKAKKPKEKKASPDEPPKSRLMIAAEDVRNGDYAAAELNIAAILSEKPNDAAALNLRAMMELEKGDAKKAERTLDQSIMSNPRSYYAYYNMARLILKTRGTEGKDAARRYYMTGREYGGPEDKRLENALQ